MDKNGSPKMIYLSCWDDSNKRYERIEGTIDECVSKIKSAKGIVSASLQLSLEMDEVKREAPADSYQLRRYNFNTITALKDALGWKEPVDVSFETYASKKLNKNVRVLRYSTRKDEPQKSK
jgi:hypothetical protein